MSDSTQNAPQTPLIPWAERKLIRSKLSIEQPGQQSHERVDSLGIVRGLYKSDFPVHFVETRRPRIGGRNHFVHEQGLHILASEEGSFRVISITQANQGFLEVLDWKLIPDLDPEHPLEYEEKSESRVIAAWAPPILGPYQLDANFVNGLVVRVTGGHGAPMMTVVWYLASDIGNGVNGSGINGK